MRLTFVGLLIGLTIVGTTDEASATAFTGVRLDIGSAILLDTDSSTTVSTSELAIPTGPSAFIEADTTRGTLKGQASADHGAGQQASAGASIFEAGSFVVSNFTTPVTFRFRYDIAATVGEGGVYSWGLTLVLGSYSGGIDLSAIYDTAVGSVIEDGNHSDVRILDMDADTLLVEATLNSAVVPFDFGMAIGLVANTDVAATFSLFLPDNIRMIPDSGEFLSAANTVEVAEPWSAIIVVTALAGLLIGGVARRPFMGYDISARNA
ncbi:hypothetical protein [Desertibaculum subflavum]|uniref:hypothetical protein n=1 Tax=Desertibaculum subflavum TaxID=2268458 RepID=UPI0013C3F10A